MKINSLQDLLAKIKNNILPQEDNSIILTLGETQAYLQVFDEKVTIVIKYTTMNSIFITEKPQNIITATLDINFIQDTVSLNCFQLKVLSQICELIENNDTLFKPLLKQKMEE